MPLPTELPQTWGEWQKVVAANFKDRGESATKLHIPENIQIPEAARVKALRIWYAVSRTEMGFTYIHDGKLVIVAACNNLEVGDILCEHYDLPEFPTKFTGEEGVDNYVWKVDDPTLIQWLFAQGLMPDD